MYNNEPLLVSDCLKSLGFKLIGDMALKETNGELIKGYAKIAAVEARKQNDCCVLDRLYFAGFEN